MKRAKDSAVSRRLLVASLVFGLFVLFDIALFGWLIFRSLSQREIERVLLETRAEAEALAKQIARRAEREGRDLYTAVAVERETQTYIDQILRQREIVRTVEIRDKAGVLVFQARSEATVVQPGGSAGEVAAPPPAGIGSPELQRRVERQGSRREEISEWASTFQVPEIQVPIGDFGQLQIGLSAGELSRRIGVLREDLIRQTAVVAVISMVLLVAAYVSVWQLLRRSRRLELQAAEAERMAYIGTLASGLAHEIRNPLNSLNLNMQMLEEEIDERGPAPPDKRLLTITRSEISRLERLVTDFLAYAKPRPLELEEIPVARLLDRVPEVLAGEIQKRGARVEVEDQSVGASVRVDRGQMTQLLLNLAQNSLAAAEEAGRRPVLRLTAARQGGSVLLEVEDNGAGIPLEEQGRVFDLFYSTKKGGTGLGLAIVDRIARAHGGQARVRSTPGEGTTVTVEIPSAAPETPPK